MIKNVDTSVTTQSSSSLAALEPCIKAKVLLEAGLQVVNKLDLLVTTSESRLQIQYNSLSQLLDTLVKYTLRYWPAALQHIPCLHSTFDGNGVQHRLTFLRRALHGVLSLYTTRIQQNHVHLLPSKLAAFVYRLTSTWLQLSPISTHSRSQTYSVSAMSRYSLLPRQHLRMLPVSLLYSDVVQVTDYISLPGVWSCTLVWAQPNTNVQDHTPRRDTTIAKLHLISTHSSAAAISSKVHFTLHAIAMVGLCT